MMGEGFLQRFRGEAPFVDPRRKEQTDVAAAFSKVLREAKSLPDIIAYLHTLSLDKNNLGGQGLIRGSQDMPLIPTHLKDALLTIQQLIDNPAKRQDPNTQAYLNNSYLSLTRNLGLRAKVREIVLNTHGIDLEQVSQEARGQNKVEEQRFIAPTERSGTGFARKLMNRFFQRDH